MRHVAAAVVASEILLQVGEPGRVALLPCRLPSARGRGVRILLARAAADRRRVRGAARSADAARRLVGGRGQVAAGYALALIALGRQEEAAAALAESGRSGRRGPALDRAAGAYVAAHFDAFADSFDDVLLRRLGYRLPELICAALGATSSLAQLDCSARAVGPGCARHGCGPSPGDS